MWWANRLAFIINKRTYELIQTGEFDELFKEILTCIYYGYVIVEAPKNDVLVDKLLGSDKFFKEFYKEYFDRYIRQQNNAKGAY